MAGAFLAQGILIALLDREVSGEGRWVQTSLMEAGIALLDFQAARWTMDKKVPPPQEGNFHPTATPMGFYPTADGFLNLAATGNNKNFEKLATLISRPDMATDPRFSSIAARGTTRETLNEVLGNALRAKTSREWFDLLVEGLPCGPVYDIKEVFADPQVETLRIKRPVKHPRFGDVDLIAQPCEITGFDRVLRQRPKPGNTSMKSCSRWAMTQMPSKS